MSTSWAGIESDIAEAAPLLGSLVGGPAGGVVGGLIAHALGVPNIFASSVAVGNATLKRCVMALRFDPLLPRCQLTVADFGAFLDLGGARHRLEVLHVRQRQRRTAHQRAKRAVRDRVVVVAPPTRKERTLAPKSEY